MSRATVTYCGVPMSVEYDYTPGEGQTWTDPGYPACAEMHSCKVGGVQVLDMLSAEQREAIETLILDERGEVDADSARERQWERQEEALAERGYP